MVGNVKTKEFEPKNIGAQFPFETLDQPGTYISNWTGHLLRIPEEGLRTGHSPAIMIKGREPMFVTKLSEDPFLSINKARMIAADLDITINF
jgi:hypothetical protein